ncbi:Protein ACOX-1 b, partial [Aphelenchoides avenae]
MGANFIDNGFLRLDNVRIPRRRMLMKFAKVLPDGTYVPPIHDKLGYSSMTYIRSTMIRTMAQLLARAAVISVRYSCVRRQGEIREGTGEVKILDYQTQRWRLFPQLARAFAFLFAGNSVRELYYSVFKNVNDDQISVLADLHAISSGLKAVVTHQASLGIEQCRMACGGHGYSDASGLPLLYVSTVAGCTYEGENMVMLQQLARYLMKQASTVRLGSRKNNSTALVAYLFKTGPTRCRIDPNTSSVDYEHLLEAFEHASRRITLAAFDKLSRLMRDGMDRNVAWNETTVDLNK